MNSYLKKDLEQLQQKFTDALANASTVQALEELRVNFFGKKGFVPELLAQLKTLSLDEKKEFGPLVQSFSQDAQALLTTKKYQLVALHIEQENARKKHFDVTAILPNRQIGHLHPYTQFEQKIQDIFISMGFTIAQGPEYETDFYNFTALNIPKDHPARDMHDTFWTTQPGYLLRTHTSNVQIRTLQNQQPPVAVVCPGRTYRYEAVDASHDIVFMQLEGFLVDKNINVANLFATVQEFLKQLFGKTHIDIRVRPSYFPFVEPGFEIDMRCVFCKNGCSVCKQSTWIEVCGSGLIHREVLTQCGIDAEVYSGFAFGFGLTRLAMLYYGIDDIRHLYGGKCAFLEQF